MRPSDDPEDGTLFSWGYLSIASRRDPIDNNDNVACITSGNTDFKAAFDSDIHILMHCGLVRSQDGGSTTVPVNGWELEGTFEVMYRPEWLLIKQKGINAQEVRVQRVETTRKGS